jgi:N-acetylglucosaminyldiphosphoundecaprenol N-acetyl-beta-D-mannosaminyltransferase
LSGRLRRRPAALLKKADLLVPEGRGAGWAARRFRQESGERFAVIDVFMNLIRLSIEKKQTVFFLGGEFETLTAAMENLRKNFPEIRIIGSHHGFFNQSRQGDIVKAIKKFSPDYVFVGMGFPYQDQWVMDNRDGLPDSVFIGVGNAFDLCAGESRRGPQWMRRLGLEGLDKALHRPWRIIRFFKLPVFIVLVFWDRLFRKKG